jgi:hypothetical protein
MRTRHNIEKSDDGQEDEGEQLVISVQHDVNDPHTIVLVLNKVLFKK